MSLFNILNQLSFNEQQALVAQLSKSIIKDPNLSQETVWKSLSVLETIVSLNIKYDFTKMNLVIDSKSKHIVQSELENTFNLKTGHLYTSNHQSDVLGVSLAIALESDLPTIVLMDDFSMNYGKSFESLIQINNHKPNLSIVFFDPFDTYFEDQPAMNLWINSLRLSNTYTSFKKDVKSILSNPVGQPLLHTLSRVKEGVKGMMIEPTIFTQFGFTYHGPIKGNNLKDNLKVFNKLKDFEGLHLIHVNSNIESIKNLKLPTYKVEDGLPEDYISYLDAIDGALTQYDDIIVCADISKDSEHMPQFAIKYPDHYYVSTGTIRSFIDFAKGLLIFDKKVVFVVSSFQFKHVIPLIEEQLGDAKNILFVLRDSGLLEIGDRITQGLFDVGFSSLLTENIYMGQDLNESVGLLHHILNQEDLPLSILRIPNAYEKQEQSKVFTPGWKVFNLHNDNKGIIFAYGPTVKSIINKIKVNELNVGVVNCKNIFDIDINLIHHINQNNIPVIFYDLEDYHHTLYGVVNHLITSDRIYNFNLKNTDLNLNARDLKHKYQLNTDHILSKIEKDTPTS